MNKTPLLSGGAVLVRPDFLHAATGPVTIPMTNDYLFHALLQNDNEALRGLICSLLHLHSAQVDSVIITNPIELGASMDIKDFVLDIKILLNNRTVINLELQVINRHNWPERSLSYLCRVFDSLNPAENYQLAKPAIHIGLLDFTLFPDAPEFYSTNMMMNVKSHKIYSDKLRLSVLDLTHIDLATDEDRLYHIDSWAALFKATTWEEIKMIAQKDENIAKAANTIWKLSQEEKIRLQCEAREDFYRNQRDMQSYMEMQAKEIVQQNNIIALQTSELTSQVKTISRQEQEITARAQTITQQEQEIAARAQIIARQEQKITTQSDTISRQEQEITAQSDTISRQEQEITAQSDTISQQEQEITAQSDTISRQEQEIARQQKELNQNAIQKASVLIQQIRNFYEKDFTPQACADMLGADSSLVESIYHELQHSPAADNAHILELLKDRLFS